MASLIALGACSPGETGGGGGGGSGGGSASSSGDASSSAQASSSSGNGGAGGDPSTSSSSSAGSGGAGGDPSSSSASSSSASSSSGAGGDPSSSSASSSSASSSSASSSSSSSSSGSGGGGGGGPVTVAWTKAIPSGGNLGVDIGGISAKTQNRLFIGGRLAGGSLTYASVTVSDAPPHHLGYVLSMDGTGNPVSNAAFGNASYNYIARLFATDAASNVFVAGDASGASSTAFLPVQKFGASPWLQKPGGVSANGSPIALDIVADLTGNLLINLFTPLQGADFGGGTQMGGVLLKLDGATGGFVWNKPSPGGSMQRDSAGNLLFLASAPPNMVVAKYDANVAPLWTKSIDGSLSGKMAVGPGGEIAIAGTFQGALDFGCGYLVSPAGVTSFAVARLDASGNCLYSKRFGAGGYSNYRLNLGITAGGKVVVASEITSAVDFGGGAVAPGTFLLKLDAAGAWVSSTSLPATQLFSAVDAQGAVYLVGGDFDAGTGPILGNVPGIAVAKLVP